MQKATMCVKIGDQLSNFFTSDIGVHQGDILSPNLFNIYINNLVQEFDNLCEPVFLRDRALSCLLYAHDLVLLSTSEKGLQHAIDKVQSYCEKWNLKINVNKTHIMIFSKGGRSIKSNIKLNKQ